MGPGRRKILDATPTGGGLSTIATIAEQVGVSYSTARVHLRELRKSGHVTRTKANGIDFYRQVPVALNAEGVGSCLI